MWDADSLRFCATLLLLGRLLSAAANLDITLAHGTPTEARTREQLQHLLASYDLSSWTWTSRIVIEDGAIPHSHPVLTISSRALDDNMLLSTYVHEQYHWYETDRPDQVAAANSELKKLYPGVAVGGQDGASDEESSYLHLIVCYAEYQEMILLVGRPEARRIMDFWAKDHYRKIYELVLRDEQPIGDIARRHSLYPPSR